MSGSPISNLLKARQQAAVDHVGVLEGVIETWESEYAVIKHKLQLKNDELQERIAQTTHLEDQLKTVQNRLLFLENRGNYPLDPSASTSTSSSSSIDTLNQIQAQLESETKLRTRYQKRLMDSSRHVDALLELISEKDHWREREASMVMKVEALESKIRALNNKNWNFGTDKGRLNEEASATKHETRISPGRSDSSKIISVAAITPLSPSSNDPLSVTVSSQHTALQASYRSLQAQHEQLQEKHRSRKQEWTNFATRYIQDLTEFRAAKKSRGRRHLEKREDADSKGRRREVAKAQADDDGSAGPLKKAKGTSRHIPSIELSHSTEVPPYSPLEGSPSSPASPVIIAQKLSSTLIVKKKPSDTLPLTSRNFLQQSVPSKPLTEPLDLVQEHLSLSNQLYDPTFVSSVNHDQGETTAYSTPDTGHRRVLQSASNRVSDMHIGEDVCSRPNTGLTATEESVLIPTIIADTPRSTNAPSSSSATKWLGKSTLHPVIHDQDTQNTDPTVPGRRAISIKRSSSSIDRMVTTSTHSDLVNDWRQQSRKRRSPVQLEREKLEFTVKKELVMDQLPESHPQHFEADVPNPHISRAADYMSDSEEKAPLEAKPGFGDTVSRSTSGLRQSDDSGSDWTDTAKKNRPVDPTAGMTPEEKKIFLKSLRNKKPKEVTALFAGFKGNGRYALADSEATTSKTINEEFEIIKDNNQGVDYAFNRVVRKKDERKQLHATDCECCSGYYEAVGALPPGPQGPRWRSPAPEADSEEKRKCSDTRTREETSEERVKRLKRESVQMRKQNNSRHRADWEEPPTPPGYWNIGFPSSPEIAAQNREAERMAQAKRARVEEEASRVNGRYQRR